MAGLPPDVAVVEITRMRTGQSNFKGYTKAALARFPVVRGLATIATRNQPRIFVFHRFSESPDPEPTVIDAATFAWQVRFIQRNFLLMTLGEYIRRVREKGEIPGPIAILTIDDGYRDFYEIAYPILRKHGVPATFFITVNFIEDKIWLWPDILRFALENSREKLISFRFENTSFEVPTGDPETISREWGSLSDFCIRLDDDKKWVLIYSLLAAARVDLPREMDAKYAPVTWEQIREMKGEGIEIGSHTMNHPVLARVRDERLLREEIAGSRRAIEERIGERVATFCYPNSMPGDIDDRVVREVKEAGYCGAVFGTGAHFDDIFRLSRIGVSSDKTDFLWKTCGLENLTGQFRFG
jgi:peptidoglycan/xylan/chitin deacetylase (PgdA/CDA1 family)